MCGETVWNARVDEESRMVILLFEVIVALNHIGRHQNLIRPTRNAKPETRNVNGFNYADV